MIHIDIDAIPPTVRPTLRCRKEKKSWIEHPGYRRIGY